MRVEHARGGQALTEFELLVQKELGITPSTSDLLLKQEKEEETKERENIYQQVLKKTQLPERQRQCFESVIIRGISFYEAAKKLGISRRTARSAVKRVGTKLIKLTARYLEGRKLRENPRFRLLTEHERNLFTLYYEDLLSVSDIARLLKVSPPTVFGVLKHILEHKIKNDP